jgi:cellulose synthase/poly-beta-1,6-N-acetylglucosamine synthase-like glycosyltransferase
VIIAGRNEEDYIGACLESVLASDYPKDKFEILFVDDHSVDNTLAIVRSYEENSGGILKVLSAPDKPHEMGSKKRALTSAIQKSSSGILVFTDADNRVSPGWIRGMVSQFSPDTGAVIGAAIPKAGGEQGSLLYRLERMMVALTSASPVGWGFPGSACGQNLAMRREAFEQIGGYAHSQVPSGDDDLTVQAIAMVGWKVRFATDPASVVLDERQPTLRAHKDATTRHQSVTRFYPMRWRLLYLFSILSGVLIVSLICFGLFKGSFPLFFWSSVGLKVIIDSLSLRTFTKPLEIRVSFADYVAANLMLPLYQIIRPLFMLRSRYRWRNEAVVKASRSLSQNLD